MDKPNRPRPATAVPSTARAAAAESAVGTDQQAQTQNAAVGDTATARTEVGGGTVAYINTEPGAALVSDSSANTQASGPVPPPTKPAPAVKLAALGDYKLVKKLGAGAMGEVYKAQQVSLDREVALKVMSRNLARDKTFVERFRREARVMARLDHPNIIRSYDVGEENGYHYLAMEFVDGGSLEDWLKKLGRFSVGDAVRVIIDVARGLEHAHELKMIHRDIKPGNVLLSKKGVIKVADLGLAKATDEDLSLTNSGVGAGTPYYMSPEQTRDAKHVDGRSDIYALGCMLYCLITGELPFKGTTHLELIEAKEKGRFPPARRVNMEVPERLDLMTDKMLARDPNKRYQTCTELIADLEGLGLASDTLTFLKPADGAAKPAAAAPRPSTAATKPAAATKPGPATRPAAPSSSGAAAAPGTEMWYVRFRRENKKVLKRVSTAQLQELIKDPDFDLEAEFSDQKEEGYRKVATAPQFESALRGRLAKVKVDRKMKNMKQMYGQIMEEDKKQQRWRWFTNLFRGAMGWAMLAGWLAAIAVVGYVLYLGGGAVLTFIGKYFEGWFR